jgi:hypothetical protein
MRALGKTPNDPMLRNMSSIQWRLCVLNVMEDEKDVNLKTRDIVGLGVKLFAGTPAPGEDTGRSVGESAPLDYMENGVRYIRSSEYDKIIQSGGKYQGFGAEEVKEK